MKLRFLESISGLIPGTERGYDYACGQVVDVQEGVLVADFLAGRIAVEVEEEAEVAALKAPEVAVRRRGRPRKAG